MTASNPKVWVTEIGARGTICVRWREPDGSRRQETIGRKTGKKREDESLMRQAYVRAEEIRQQLIEEAEVVTAAMEDPVTSDRMSWHEFSNLYKRDYLADLSNSNRKLWKTAANHLEEAMKESPESLDDIRRLNVKTLEAVRTHLRGRCAPASVDTYIATLRAGLSYGCKLGLCESLPPQPMRKSQPKMRGRALTREEMERMVKAVPKVIKQKALVKGYRDWITGLYLSGLRLGESLDMHWKDPNHHVPVLSRIPKINFNAGQKNRQIQVVAMAPDFADFLKKLAARPGGADGYVFNPTTPTGGRIKSIAHASGKIAAIGEAAGVTTEPGRHASAHDLRRSFGSRWALLVMPVVLQHMMRHASIETTSKYYINHTADLMGREIKAAYESKGLQYVNSDVAGEVIAQASGSSV